MQNENVQEQAHDHPTPATFWKVGAVLFAMTAVEFGTFYLSGMRTFVVVLLLVLSTVKFYLVGSYFMHLRFEKKILGVIFLVGVLLAVFITLVQKLISFA
jgi:cytochrome c oxidase subunit 4